MRMSRRSERPSLTIVPPCTTKSSCTAFTFYVCFARKTWLSEMYMSINDAGKNETSRGIYYLVIDSSGCF